MARKFYVAGIFSVEKGTQLPHELSRFVTREPHALNMGGEQGDSEVYHFILTASTGSHDPDVLKKELTHKLRDNGGFDIRLQFAFVEEE